MSEEFSRDVETNEPVVAGLPASRQLRECRAESVGKVQLKAVTSRALLDAEASVHGVRRIAKSWNGFPDEKNRRPYPQAPAQSHDEGVVVVVGELIGVVHPDRMRIQRTVAAEGPRN